MKSAVCNELFGTMDFARSCDLLAETGFDGIEIAPFTLAPDTGVPSSRVLADVRRALSQSGISFVGLHWLLARPEGLNISANDTEVRERSWEHLKTLLKVAGELEGGVLVLGSPKQRSFTDISKEEAVKRLTDGLSGVAETARQNSSLLLLEALPHQATNLINTIQEARDVVAAVNSPAIGTLFDFHNTPDETFPWEKLIIKHGSAISHVHLNTPEGGHPTVPVQDSYAAAFSALATVRYSGWVSLEIFTEPEDPASVLMETQSFLKSLDQPQRVRSNKPRS